MAYFVVTKVKCKKSLIKNVKRIVKRTHMNIFICQIHAKFTVFRLIDGNGKASAVDNTFKLLFIANKQWAIQLYLHKTSKLGEIYYCSFGAKKFRTFLYWVLFILLLLILDGNKKSKFVSPVKFEKKTNLGPLFGSPKKWLDS